MTPEEKIADRKAYQAAWRLNNAAQIKANYEKTKDFQQARSLAYYYANKENALVRMKAWREANKERHSETKKAYYRTHKAEIAEKAKLNRPARNARTKAWRLANPDKDREAQLRWRAKNPGHWRKHLPAPTRPCPEKCENPGCRGIETTRKLALDHCHETNTFRGWLCGPCNTSIGKLGDTELGLISALAYLKQVSPQEIIECLSRLAPPIPRLLSPTRTPP